MQIYVRDDKCMQNSSDTDYMTHIINKIASLRQHPNSKYINFSNRAFQYCHVVETCSSPSLYYNMALLPNKAVGEVEFVCMMTEKLHILSYDLFSQTSERLSAYHV